MTEISIKQETIIEAAIRRFSHFGLSKTTLGEIARDLSISKTSVFYYFKDKNTLIVAVFQKLIDDFLHSYRCRLNEQTTAEEAVYLLIDARKEFFQNNMQLALQASSVPVSSVSPGILKPIIKAQKEIHQLINDLLQKGMKAGDIQEADTSKVAGIILDTLQSHETCLRQVAPFPTEQDVNNLFEKQKSAVRLFFNGVKNIKQ